MPISSSIVCLAADVRTREGLGHRGGPMRRVGGKKTKTLSENRQIEQDVGAGKLNERQPVFSLLRPASAQATSLDEPRNRPLHYPSPRRMNLLREPLLGRTLGTFSSGIDLDVRLVARCAGELPYVVRVVGFVGAQMLLLVSRALWHHRNDQIDGGDFVVAIGSGENDRDGSAVLIDEEVHLRS